MYLLQYIVFEKTDFQEHELILNKLLTGFKTDMPVPRNIELTEEEINTVNSLMQSILQHWSKLKNTSVAGLREAFLQREGKLEEKENSYLLTVEEKAYDMLLDSVPWSFRTIKYSWMEKAIQYFQQLLQTAFSAYFNREKGEAINEKPAMRKDEIEASNEELTTSNHQNSSYSSLLTSHLFDLLPENHVLIFEEEVILLLALMPHISPETLDVFFIWNKETDRPCTEYGGWLGVSHGGFLPTGQTAYFLIY